eukprot:110144-Amphidinium_carterae.1
MGFFDAMAAVQAAVVVATERRQRWRSLLMLMSFPSMACLMASCSSGAFSVAQAEETEREALTNSD